MIMGSSGRYAVEAVRDHEAMPQHRPANDEDILFRNGTVFDGHRFLPAGTWVRVRGGRITGVGPAESLGPLGSAEPVDLDGGTLLPGIIDAHAPRSSRVTSSATAT
jgi:N-acyl-D-aspartate/D-glutamate deacylase